MIAKKRLDDDLGLNDLMEDFFGLNIRGLKSIFFLFVRPRVYMRAAVRADWAGRYTPSLRLWVSLMAVLYFFQFFWAGETSGTVLLLEQQFADRGDVLPAGTSAADLAKAAANWQFTLQPFFAFGFMFIAATLWRGWGQATGFTLRERLLFAVAVPSLVVSLPTVLLFGLVSAANYVTYGIYFILSVFAMNWLTAYRSLPRAMPMRGRAWRSGATALVIGIAMSFANILAQSIATLIVLGGG